MQTHVAAFYTFRPLGNLAHHRQDLFERCAAAGLKGILLLAPEGVNGTLSGPIDGLRAVLAHLAAVLGAPAAVRWSAAETKPFLRLKVRVKREIVALGDPTVDPGAGRGIAVSPEHWNALIADPDVLVLDVRNGFEVALGSFARAHDPGTVSFSDFPAFVRDRLDPARHKRIAMFCTGGIRCEKASAFMLREGFETVHQLDGGILAYLERVPVEKSLWRGACFVFDGRVGVGHRLAPDLDLSTCHGCRHPLTPADRASPSYEEGITCPFCAETASVAHARTARERHRQMQHAADRGYVHLGPEAQIPNGSNSPVRKHPQRNLGVRSDDLTLAESRAEQLPDNPRC